LEQKNYNTVGLVGWDGGWIIAVSAERTVITDSLFFRSSCLKLDLTRKAFETTKNTKFTKEFEKTRKNSIVFFDVILDLRGEYLGFSAQKVENTFSSTVKLNPIDSWNGYPFDP
jgi:hypothetical protein